MKIEKMLLDISDIRKIEVYDLPYIRINMKNSMDIVLYFNKEEYKEIIYNKFKAWKRENQTYVDVYLANIGVYYLSDEITIDDIHHMRMEE